MRLFSPFDLLILALVIFSANFVFMFKNFTENNDNFVIFADGQKIEIPFERDTILIINSAKIRIENGTAQIEKNNCRHQICVAQTPLSENGQIVCVPNKIVVSLNRKSDNQLEIDVYAH